MKGALDAFDLPYQPQDPESYRPGIGLVGCGAITKHHLQAYVVAGYDVCALCDLDAKRAKARRDEFYPKAKVYSDIKKLLADKRVEVVDITTHPPERPPLIEAAIEAGKHVLSQKPFVTDLDEGERLASLAEKRGVLLAVNQNGRWAPNFSYLRQAVAAGLLGDVVSAHFNCHWDHTWVEGTPFENVRHLILYDYAIHWFDMVCALFAGNEPTRVFASTAKTANQTLMPPLLGQALIEFEDAQASLVFDACNSSGGWQTTFVVGTKASLRSEGTSESEQQVVLKTAAGEWRPHLTGKWFDDGFHGAMAELLSAIEQRRQPIHNARDNLRSLALCFAALESADTHQPVVPGTVRKLRD